MELIWDMSREIKKRCNAFPFSEEETPTIVIIMLIDWGSAIFVSADLASIKALFCCLLEIEKFSFDCW